MTTERTRLAIVVSSAALLATTLVSYHASLLEEFEPDPSSVIQLSEIERQIDAERWANTALPNDWLLNRYDRTEEWYRHDLHLNVPPDRLWGVMLTAVNLNAAVYLNGKLLGTYGRLEEPISHNWNQPLVFYIPSGLLRSGQNELKVRVVSYPAGHGFLGQIYLGPAETLNPHYERMMFFNIELSRFVTGVSFILAVVLGVIWLLRRRDTEYGWFALTVLFWSVYSTKFHVTEVPVSSFFWAWCLFLCTTSVSYTFFTFVERLRGLRRRRLDGALLGLWCVSTTAITIPMLMGTDHMYLTSQIAYAVSFCIAIAGFVGTVRHALSAEHRESTWLAGAISFLIAIVVYDAGMIFGFADRTTGQLAVFGVPTLLGAFSIIMLRRFIAALDDREQLLHTVQERAEDAAQRIVELETEAALAEQRETIMRDMHDGVGGQLVSSLAILSERSDHEVALLRETLKNALTDLRLMIDSLDTETGDLNFLLGAFRARTEPPLRASGYEVAFSLPVLPERRAQTAHDNLQILRILQEAITNAIKHARATRISVSAEVMADARIRLTVSDDGCGLANDRSGGGRGLMNMRRRAQEIDADIEFRAEPGCGTRVALTLSTDDIDARQYPDCGSRSCAEDGHIHHF